MLAASIFASILTLSISIAFRFMWSFVSSILLWMIILCRRSSWLSMSRFTATCCTLVCSLWPIEMTSSKAKISSKAPSITPSSSSATTYSGTTFPSSRSVSMSSRMFDCRLVTRRR